MGWDPTNNRWQGNETYLLLMDGAFHPGLYSEAALKWVAPQPGIIRLTGNVSKADTNGGIGIIASILQGTNTLWGPVQIAYNDNIGQSSDLFTTVAAGDPIYFLVNSIDQNNGNDTTAWNPAIAYTVLLTPPNLACGWNGSQFVFSWPNDYFGWMLMMQTNHLAGGVSGNPDDWSPMFGTQTNNQYFLPFNPAAPIEFYRLFYP